MMLFLCYYYSSGTPFPSIFSPRQFNSILKTCFSNFLHGHLNRLTTILFILTIPIALLNYAGQYIVAVNEEMESIRVESCCLKLMVVF